jgi:hypothetical protein
VGGGETEGVSDDDEEEESRGTFARRLDWREKDDERDWLV